MDNFEMLLVFVILSSRGLVEPERMSSPGVPGPALGGVRCFNRASKIFGANLTCRPGAPNGAVR
jgi:hypothetical protein